MATSDPGLSMMAGARVEANPGKPVYDKDGKVLGRVGEDPTPVEIRPEDIMLQALNNEHERQKQAIGALLDEAGNLAWEAANKVRPKANFLAFNTRIDASVKLADLRARLDGKKKELDAALIKLGSAPEFVDFRKAVAEQINEIEDVFAGRPR